MSPLLTQASRCRRGLAWAALLVVLMAAPAVNAAEKFSVRATLTPVPVQQASGIYTLSARLGRTQAEKNELLGATFGLIGTLSPIAPMVCYGDTIFRDGFGYP